MEEPDEPPPDKEEEKEDKFPLIKQVLLKPRPENSEVAISNLGVAQKNPGDEQLHLYPRVDIGKGRRIHNSHIDYIGASFEGQNVIVDDSSRRTLLDSRDADVSYEDPRATVVEGVCHLTYTKFNRRKKTVDIGLALSEDLVNFHEVGNEVGTISPSLTIRRALELIGSKRRYADYQWAWFETWRAKEFWPDAYLDFKNFAFFPEKKDGKFVLTARVLPNMLLLEFDELKDLERKDFWENIFSNLDKYILMKPMKGNEGWQVNRIGVSSPPLKRGDEWVLFYHGVRLNPKQYCNGAAVLNENLEVVRRTKEPIFSPEEAWEKYGLKNNVVYLTGTAFNHGLHFFGGAADTVSFQVGPYRLEKIIEKCEPV